MPLAHFPLFIDNLECNIFIRWAGIKSYHQSIWCIRRFQEVLRRFSLINQIRVENVELVALHCLWRRIVDVVVGLVVLIPFIASLNCIEEARLSWFIFIFPCIFLYGNLRVHVCALKYISELFFILSNSFSLELLIHIEWWVIKSHGVYIEPY